MKNSILFIFCDQFRADCLSCLGHPDVKTPHLDRLARDGVLFRNTVTQSPVCVPARVSLFSGRYVHQHGCFNNARNLWPETPNFIRAIRDTGYTTANVGKLHLFWRHDNELLMSDPLHRRFGFTDPMETTGKCSEGRVRASVYTEYLKKKGLLEPFWNDLIARVKARTLGVTFGPSILDEKDQMDGWIMDRGIDFLRLHQKDSQPWLLWVGPEGPHDPFDPPGKWAKMYEPAKLQVGIRRLSEDPQAAARALSGAVKDAPDHVVQEMRANYYGNISFIDHKIGEMIDGLKRDGRYDDTWIIFAADHGEMLGDFHLTSKVIFHRQADEVPLIIKPPKSLEGCPRGQVSDALVELIDVATTMRTIAGGDLPGDQGRSLLPLLGGRADLHHHRDSLHSQVQDTCMIRTATRKMVFKNPDQPDVLAFYDLEKDPQEFKNLRHERVAEIEAFIENEVKPFYASTRDKLPPQWNPGPPYAAWGNRNPHFEILG